MIPWKHGCLTAWLYIILAVGVVTVSLAADGEARAEAGVQVDAITQLVMQGGFGAFALAELSRWRDLGAQLIRILDSALNDLRDGKMTVRHEHVDIDGNAVERRRPKRASVRDGQAQDP